MTGHRRCRAEALAKASVTQEDKWKLHSAAKEGNVGDIQRALARGVGIDTVFGGWNGGTALGVAVRNGNEDAALELLRLGADPNLKCKNCETPIWSAAFHGHPKLVKALLSRGADPDSRGNVSNSPLMEAIRNGHWDIAGALIRNNADFEATRASGHTPLMAAAAAGNLTTVRLLIEKGAAVYRKDVNGLSAIGFAQNNKHPEVVKYLVEHSADIHMAWNDPCETISAAAESGNMDIVGRLLDEGAPMDECRDIYVYAVEQGNAELLKRLFDAKVDTRHSQVSYATIKSGNVEATVNLLTAHNIELGSVDSELVKSARDGNTAMVKLLLKKGANIDAVGKYDTLKGKTALMVAVEKEHVELVRLLLANGASPNIQRVTGDKYKTQRETAVMMAADYGNAEIIRLLLDANAEINMVDSKGETALMHASKYHGEPAAVALLLKNGAAVNAVSNGGATALDLTDGEKVSEILIAHGGRMGPAGKKDQKERRKKIGAALGRVTAGLIPGAAYLTAGLLLQLKTYDRQIEKNHFNFANYAVTELTLALATLVCLAVTLYNQEAVFGVAAFLAASVAWGILGWKYRNNEGVYFGSVSGVSAVAMAISLPFTLDW